MDGFKVELTRLGVNNSREPVHIISCGYLKVAVPYAAGHRPLLENAEIMKVYGASASVMDKMLPVIKTALESYYASDAFKQELTALLPPSALPPVPPSPAND